MAETMPALITDRTEEDAQLVRTLAQKNWEDMTEGERYAWWHGVSRDYIYWLENERVACLDGPIEFIYEGPNRGAYNAVDLNRVETAVSYLARRLRELPGELRAYAQKKGVAWADLFDVSYDPKKFALTVKTDWTLQDKPTPEDMERYLGNVKTLRGAIEYDTDPLPEDMRKLTWEGANAIERALLGLNKAIDDWPGKKHIDAVAAWQYHSGDLKSGEVQ